MEVDYESLFKKHNYGLIAWGPIAGGYLTGKYANGIPQDTVNRYNDTTLFFPVAIRKALFYDKFATEKTSERLKNLTALA